MSGLHFGNQYISYEDLVHSKSAASNPYFNTILDFCRSYLAGEQKFPVKTSGSTGKPKTINLTRSQLKASAKMTISALSLQPDYRALVCISTDHIGGKMMLVRGMESGMELYIIEPDAEPLVREHPVINFVALVPLQLRALINSEMGRDFLYHCQVVIVGGGTLDPSLKSELDQFPNPIFQTFGMTETVSHIALRRLNGPVKERYFQAFTGMELSLDDRGCLVVCGEVTNHLPVVTNDLVEIVGDGQFRWLGRIDQVINSGGHKIHVAGISPIIFKALKSAGMITNFVIIGLPNPKWGEKVTLVVETDNLSEVSKQQILEKLKTELHPYEVPKSINHLTVFPRTVTGKVDNFKMKEMLLSASI